MNMNDSDQRAEELSDNSNGSDEEQEMTLSIDENSEQNGYKNKRSRDEEVTETNTAKKKRKSDLFKPPTVEELNNLKETENLYNNNLFRLQIEELVKEIAVKNKTKKQLTVWLDAFKKCIESIPESTDMIVTSVNTKVTKKLSKEEEIIHSYVNNANIGTEIDGKLILKIPNPAAIETFGLYENECLPGPDVILHVNIKMPKKYFHTKDFLNGRYLIKKYYFLKHVAKYIQAKNIAEQISFILHYNNPILPIMLVKPINTKRILVKMHATPVDDCFKPSRFLPEVNNVKIDPFKSFVDQEVLKSSPTVFYNSSLGHDVTLSSNSDCFKNILNGHGNVQEGIKLLCVWLNQRQFNVGAGAFKKHYILYFVAYLLAKKKINKFMSSYQVVRNFWSFISTFDIQNTPISMTETSGEVLKSFKQYFQLVFLDNTGCYNLLAFMNVDTYNKIKIECDIALKLLDENRSNAFHILFLTKSPFGIQYDLILDLTDSLPLKDKFTFEDMEKAKYVGCKYLLTINHITEILKKGFNKRILNIVPIIETNDIFGETCLKSLKFGINLNPDKAFNFIELGPALNDHIEADKFRKFWGHLSSDRRFRDGSTHVAVYFKTNTIKGKRGIIKRIVDFLLSEKLELRYKLYYDNFDEVIINKKLVASYSLGTNEEGCLKVVTVSDELGKKIRNLRMSLSITGIQGCSDVFSYTDVFPPISMKYTSGSATIAKQNNLVFSDKKDCLMPRYVQPIECVLQLEHSSKWPNDLQAVRHLKTSFYLEISKQLKEQHDIITHVTEEFIDVLYEGLVFRYRLYVPKEIGLIKQQLNEQGVLSYKSTLESFNMELQLNILPKVNASLKGLQSQFPSFGPGTAIIKRWLRCQLIDYYYIPDVVLNLLNASLYLNGTGMQPPVTPQMSFVRFLKFVSEFQWNIQPVIVNFNDELTKEDICEIESKLQENRDAFSPLYIVMPYDEGRSLITKNAPSKHVLQRVKELAKATLELFLTGIENNNLGSIKEMFIPNWTGYNVIIHLKPLMNPRKHEEFESIDAVNRVALEKFKHEECKLLPIVDFNPVDKFLRQLRSFYGEFACFFHDTYGGNKIGVLWKPESLAPKEFKVSYISGRKLQDDKLTFDMDAILDDFMLLGKGIVKFIENKDMEC